MSGMRVGGLKSLVPLLLLLALVVASPVLMEALAPEADREGQTRAPEAATPDPLADAPDPLGDDSGPPPDEIGPASLTGHVTGESGPPGEGAWVMLSGLEQELRVELDDAGNFDFREVPAGVSLDLWLGPDWTGSKICRIAERIVLKPGEHRFLEAAAPHEISIQGRVVDDSGEGLSGVRVAVLPPGVDWRDEVPVAATTGPDGRFYVGFQEGVTPKRMRLVVDHVKKGFLLKEQLVDPGSPSAREVEVILQPGQDIAGRVLLPDGSPLALARVHLLEDYQGDVLVRRPSEGLVRTDQEGRFRDNAFRPGVYRVFVYGEAGGQRFGVVKGGVIAGSEEVEIRFPGFGSLSLAFEDEDTGKPVKIIQGDLGGRQLASGTGCFPRTVSSTSQSRTWSKSSMLSMDFR